jgi:hypothetical protein
MFDIHGWVILRLHSQYHACADILWLMCTSYFSELTLFGTTKQGTAYAMHSLVSVLELLYIISYVLSLSIISTVFICITCTQLSFSLDVEYMEVLGY